MLGTLHKWSKTRMAINVGRVNDLDNGERCLTSFQISDILCIFCKFKTQTIAQCKLIP